MKQLIVNLFFVMLFIGIGPVHARADLKDYYSNQKLIQEFPIKGSLIDRVKFWKRVYTEITTKEAFLHDSKDLAIIYKKVSLPSSRRARRRYLKSERRNMRAILASIAKKGGINLNSKEQEIYQIISEKSSKKISEIKRLARQLRFQYGLKDRYFQGLIRSYEYLDYIKKIFKEYNVPEELAFLPHVESSFNYNAYSKVGAAGIWQFMRSTARLYKLKINYVVDERRDVIKATRAAAKLLRDNYRILKSWPLALTAYNHGARSIQRAVNKLGTREIDKIIDQYGGRRFGFASKNFYATFMATALISQAPEKYFKEFSAPKPFKFSVITLNRSYSIKQIAKALNLSARTLGKFNPSIRRSALRSNLALPKHFNIHIPTLKEGQRKNYQAKIDHLKSVKKNYDLERLHIISRGENLFDIATAYHIKLNDLVAFNEITNPSRIYAGMKLKIPGKNSKIKKVVVALQKTTLSKTVTKTKVETISAEKPTASQMATTNILDISSPLPLYGPNLPKDLSSLEGHHLEVKRIRNGVYQITVETDETLGHIAQWASIKTQAIRDLNHLSYGSSIRQGLQLKIPIANKNLMAFKQNRNEYHLSIQEDFFNSFKVTGTKDYKVKKGDTITSILRKLELPFWLLRRYQDNQEVSSQLKIGQVIKIPQVQSLHDSSELPSSDSLNDEE